jgi:hypothetical protein
MNLRDFRNAFRAIRQDFKAAEGFDKANTVRRNLMAVGNRLKADAYGLKDAYKGFRESATDPHGIFDAGLRAYGTRSAFLLTGAGIGAVTAGEDNRMKGAAIGAGAGLLAAGGKNLYFGRRALLKTPFGQSKLMLGMMSTTMAGGMAGAMYMGRGKPEASAHYSGEGDGGYSISPGMGANDGVYEGSTLRERQSLMQASGNIVLGSHHMRHG